MYVSTQKPISQFCCINPNLDFYYTFLIDLTLNQLEKCNYNQDLD